MILLTPPSDDERKITMTDIALFKQAATEKLPEALYQQLQPHLETLTSYYEELKVNMLQMEEMAFYEYQERNQHFEMIRQEFNEMNEPNWPAFARERWPEIDTYFNLGPPEKPSPRSPAEYMEMPE